MSVKFFVKLLMFYLSITLSNLPFGRGRGAEGHQMGGKCWQWKLSVHLQQQEGGLNPENSFQIGTVLLDASAPT